MRVKLLCINDDVEEALVEDVVERFYRSLNREQMAMAEDAKKNAEASMDAGPWMRYQTMDVTTVGGADRYGHGIVPRVDLQRLRDSVDLGPIELNLQINQSVLLWSETYNGRRREEASKGQTIRVTFFNAERGWRWKEQCARGREGLGGRFRGRRALRREGEVGTRD